MRMISAPCLLRWKTRNAAAAFCILFVLWTGGLSADVDSFEWNVRRFEGRDYVTANQIAGFYNLEPKAALAVNQIGFSDGKRSLVFLKNTRETLINGLKHWLCFPAVERDSELWVSRMDLSKTIEPSLRPELVQGIKPFDVVVLDAGHGGRDKGAASVYQYEKNFALDMVRRIRDELKARGVAVVLTRNSDVFVELPDRAAIANSTKNSIFVSIHFNAAANRAAQGFEIFSVTPRGAPSTEYEELLVRDMVEERGNESEIQSFLLAKSIYHAMHGKVPMFDRGMKRSRFAVLRLTEGPAVLVEGGFLSNPVDARRVASPEWRTKYAKAIAEGILAYRNLAVSQKAPPLVAEYRLPGSRTLPVIQPAGTPAPRPSINLRPLPE